MKKLNITWDGIADPTGYLFSFAKSLANAVKNSPRYEHAEDIVATSGFAFRMWLAKDMCPSATSIWAWDAQKPWVESGGLRCEYVGRMWGEDAIEEQRRLEAVAVIKKSIDGGIPAVVWDIGVPEWGLVTGYDDERQVFATLAINHSEGEMPYDVLGRREIPILSALAVTGVADKPQEEIFKDTLRLAVGHLRGEEWCDNAKGLAAYPAIFKFFEKGLNPEDSWTTEYCLGTYASLKYHAWKYFEKMGRQELAELYRHIYEAWLQAFQIKTGEDIGQEVVRGRIVGPLASAWANEKKAVEVMEGLI
jgi:hypothetical protein